jgi:hypothetical protein
MPLKIGTKYRCGVHGVVGTCMDVKSGVREIDYSAPEPPAGAPQILVYKDQDIGLLALDEDHLEGQGDLTASKAIDKRWYAETRLKEVDHV